MIHFHSFGLLDITHPSAVALAMQRFGRILPGDSLKGNMKRLGHWTGTDTLPPPAIQSHGTVTPAPAAVTVTPTPVTAIIIDVLKIDIEEFEWFADFNVETLENVVQLCIEMHFGLSFQKMVYEEQNRRGLPALNFPIAKQWLERMEAPPPSGIGMALFHVETNHYAPATVVELAFVNTRFFSRMPTPFPLQPTPPPQPPPPQPQASSSSAPNEHAHPLTSKG